MYLTCLKPDLLATRYYFTISLFTTEPPFLMVVLNIPMLKELLLHSFSGNRSHVPVLYAYCSTASSSSNYLLIELIQTITSFTYQKQHSKLQGDSYSFTRGVHVAGGGGKPGSTKKLV